MFQSNSCINDVHVYKDHIVILGNLSTCKKMKESKMPSNVGGFEKSQERIPKARGQPWDNSMFQFLLFLFCALDKEGS